MAICVTVGMPLNLPEPVIFLLCEMKLSCTSEMEFT